MCTCGAGAADFGARSGWSDFEHAVERKTEAARARRVCAERERAERERRRDMGRNL